MQQTITSRQLFAVLVAQVLLGVVSREGRSGGGVLVVTARQLLYAANGKCIGYTTLSSGIQVNVGNTTGCDKTATSEA